MPTQTPSEERAALSPIAADVFDQWLTLPEADQRQVLHAIVEEMRRTAEVLLFGESEIQVEKLQTERDALSSPKQIFNGKETANLVEREDEPYFPVSMTPEQAKVFSETPMEDDY